MRTLVFALLASASLSTAAQAATIDFDGTGAPCVFSSTSPLTNLYSVQGVTFGPGLSGNGGSILNECGNFGINARSGTDFLAFNGGVNSVDELISFAAAVTSLSLYVGNSSDADYTAEFFDSSNALIGSQTISLIGGSYGELSFMGAISSARIFSTSNVWVADDLSFTAGAVPEPASWALMIAGFGLVGSAMRRRKPSVSVRYA
jgi:PEP-CTERM motif